jgi:RHS repeat-associated protein
MPGPHDFAVRSDLHQASSRPCAADRRSGEGVEAPFVLRAVARSRETALRTHLRARRCRVHRIPSRVRDDREPPLFRERTIRRIELSLPVWQAKIFSKEGLDTESPDGLFLVVAHGWIERKRCPSIAVYDSMGSGTSSARPTRYNSAFRASTKLVALTVPAAADSAEIAAELGALASLGPFGYTGQRVDAETNGLYYCRARHYSPAWGRFMQVDPIGYGGGSNLYVYVGNDPLNATDPSGLAQVELRYNTIEATAEHGLIPNLAGEYSGTARDLLARDINNLRSFTNAPNSALQELIGLNKATYPEAFAR